MAGSTDKGRRVGDKSWECAFCRKKFQRSDVLRRHYKTCPSRDSRVIPRPLKRGKRRQACDACAKSKLSCDFELPCESCLLNTVSCTYERVSEEKLQLQFQDTDFTPDPGIERPEPSPLVSDSSQNPRNQPSALVPNEQGPTGQQQNKSSVSFLLNYANPDTRSLTDTFGYSTGTIAEQSDPSEISTLSYPQESPAFPYLANTMEASSYNDLLSMSQNIIFDEDDMPNMFYPDTSIEEILSGYFFPIVDISRNQSQYLPSTPMEDQSWFEEPVFNLTGLQTGIMENLIFQLTDLCISLPNDHPDLGPSMNLTQGIPLLASTNMQRLIGLYFHHWHRHSPIIHRGTFDAGKVSLQLLYAVILTGAMFSPSQDEVAMARNMLDLAEEFTFRNPTFLKLVSGIVPEDSALTGSIESLQATCSIAQIQLREGSLPKRKYTRSTRFNEMISAAQTLSLTNVKNSFFAETTSAESFQWSKFAQAEAQIRLMCGFFNLDASFTIFYNTPPRLYAKQLYIDMPCSLNSYLARNAEDCYKAAMAESNFRLPQLSTVVAIFLDKPWDVEIRNKMEGLTLMHLFIIILALLQAIWISRLYTQNSLLESVRRALGRWKAEWDMRTSGMTAQQLEQAGFLKDAAIEFWQLANILTRKGRNRVEATFEADTSLASDGKNHVYTLLQSVEKLSS